MILGRYSPFSIIFLVFTVISSCGKTNEEIEESKNQSPNVIFILADDLGYGDLSVLGQQKFQTPNIDRLAKEGMIFTQHYAGSTVCAPSRSAFLSGLHTGHTPIRGNREIFPEGQHPMADSIYTLAEFFKEQGYATGAFGKWGLGFPKSEGDPNNQGFDEFFGYNCQRYGHHYYPRHLWHNQDSMVLAANAGKQEGLYAPELIHEKTLAFIDGHKDEPFFLYVPSIIPHAELAAPKRHMSQFHGDFEPEVPYVGTDEGEDYRTGPYSSQALPHAAFAAMVTLLDEQVGEIMDKVEELELSDNTLIVFTSDNGPHLEGGADPDYFNSNSLYKGYKRDLYEGGIRVPTIMKWTNHIAPGSTTDHLSAFWDYLPTFSDLLAVDLKVATDGVSFLPTLIGKGEQETHEYLYWEFHGVGGRIAVRKDQWKAIRYDVKENPNGSFELYDLSNDVEEQYNVAEQYPEIINEMEKIIIEAHEDSEVFQFSSSTYLSEK